MAKSRQSFPTLQPHRRQPTRLPRPWDSPGKNTGVGCHFLLQSMKVKSEGEATQSCPTVSNPMDCSLPGSSIHGTFQAGVLEWSAIAFSRPLETGSLIQHFIAATIHSAIPATEIQSPPHPECPTEHAQAWACASPGRAWGRGRAPRSSHFRFRSRSNSPAT